MPAKLSAKRARELFSYDKISGVLRWRVDVKSGKGKNQVKAGARAGTVSGNGLYRQVGVDRRLYREHNLIWLIVTGAWPEHQLDHEDLNGCNNKWRNLRPATHAQNNQNKGPHPRNKSGLKGVRTLNNGRFQATISAHLGTFRTAIAAHAAYGKAARLLHGAFANTTGRADANTQGRGR